MSYSSVTCSILVSCPLREEFRLLLNFKPYFLYLENHPYNKEGKEEDKKKLNSVIEEFSNLIEKIGYVKCEYNLYNSVITKSNRDVFYVYGGNGKPFIDFAIFIGKATLIIEELKLGLNKIYAYVSISKNLLLITTGEITDDFFDFFINTLFHSLYIFNADTGNFELKLQKYKDGKETNDIKKILGDYKAMEKLTFISMEAAIESIKKYYIKDIVPDSANFMYNNFLTQRLFQMVGSDIVGYNEKINNIFRDCGISSISRNEYYPSETPNIYDPVFEEIKKNFLIKAIQVNPELTKENLDQLDKRVLIKMEVKLKEFLTPMVLSMLQGIKDIYIHGGTGLGLCINKNAMFENKNLNSSDIDLKIITDDVKKMNTKANLIEVMYDIKKVFPSYTSQDKNPDFRRTFILCCIMQIERQLMLQPIKIFRNSTFIDNFFTQFFINIRHSVTNANITVGELCYGVEKTHIKIFEMSDKISYVPKFAICGWDSSSYVGYNILSPFYFYKDFQRLYKDPTYARKQDKIIDRMKYLLPYKENLLSPLFIQDKINTQYISDLISKTSDFTIIYSSFIDLGFKRITTAGSHAAVQLYVNPLGYQLNLYLFMKNVLKLTYEYKNNAYNYEDIINKIRDVYETPMDCDNCKPYLKSVNEKDVIQLIRFTNLGIYGDNVLETDFNIGDKITMHGFVSTSYLYNDHLTNYFSNSYSPFTIIKFYVSNDFYKDILFIEGTSTILKEREVLLKDNMKYEVIDKRYETFSNRGFIMQKFVFILIIEGDNKAKAKAEADRKTFLSNMTLRLKSEDEEKELSSVFSDNYDFINDMETIDERYKNGGIKAILGNNGVHGGDGDDGVHGGDGDDGDDGGDVGDVGDVGDGSDDGDLYEYSDPVKLQVANYTSCNKDDYNYIYEYDLDIMNTNEFSPFFVFCHFLRNDYGYILPHAINGYLYVDESFVDMYKDKFPEVKSVSSLPYVGVPEYYTNAFNNNEINMQTANSLYKSSTLFGTPWLRGVTASYGGDNNKISLFFALLVLLIIIVVYILYCILIKPLSEMIEPQWRQELVVQW